MKAFNTVLKILAVLAAVAGAIYVIATYGDKIVAWAKKVWATLPQCPEADTADDVDFVQEEPVAQETDETVEEAAAEAPVEEAVIEDLVPEFPENEPVAEEADFAE